MNSNYNRIRNRIFIIGWVLILCAALILPGISTPGVNAAHPITRGDLLTPRSGDAIWLVNTLADSGPGSLREALAGAAAGDRIEFDAAVTCVVRHTSALIDCPEGRRGVSDLYF